MSESNGISDGSNKSTNTVRKTAAIIIIGDEILKGQVADANIHFLCKRLYSMGIKVGRVSVIGDSISEIAHEMRTFSSSFDIVITTGGIGPTHDDMTYLGLAEAFNSPVAVNARMASMIDFWLGHKGFQRDVIMKMAEMPQDAKLIFDAENHEPISNFPIVNLRNVYVFPGVPKFLEKIFVRLERLLVEQYGAQTPFYCRELYLNQDEMSVTPILNEAVEKFKDVTFGSYPVYGNLYFSTKLTMESQHENGVVNAVEFITNKSQNSVVPFDPDSVNNAMENVYNIVGDSKHSLHEPVRQAVKVRIRNLNH